ncbi:hypothetical protein PtrSN002B_001559 [Pyrenophora tritici-repentis]|uniref:PWWP domain containing protein n=2 Tax=Pyrenophora tritici-repentis TaxID=45151 RepID=A0A2W1FFA8_9PLEO|nr:uncharacterized protein PTRG_08586 [Pyrenophora tritici-repentis Pt-1C-BFP]KAA8615466.1 PWWP domain-containing protein [Pyrenophora tritici-repentis]EDU51505.1 predicted protein [Pyrenophora tritici-repentis Pt-1C-BFP]KAF7443958.1 PWWP domain containing protein [Pyrenophora tritici-repentis]KAF7566321.1 TT-ORF1 domain containing protein [Pyrenophora tritici-repentis]KAG9379696.1 PWWP domain containing protein [Pyrenophora tritici-repentis]
MVQQSPGSLVQYQASGTSLPPWPAVICTDDMAPTEMQRTRPNGYFYVTLVLLLDERFEFHWARTSELGEYDPFAPYENEEIVASTPRLGDAYEMANNALEAGFTLDDWRDRVNQRSVESDSCSDSDESDDDSEMQWALRASQEDYDRQHSHNRKRTLSPPKPARDSRSRITVIPRKDKETAHTDRPSRATQSNHSRTIPDNYSDFLTSRSPARPPPLLISEVASSSLPSPVLPSRLGRCDTPIDLTDDTSSQQPTANQSAPTSTNAPNRTSFQQNSFLDRTLGGLGRSFREPKSDTVDGELSQSKEFVQIPVGPDGVVSTLAKACVWNRKYWLDVRFGVNHFDLNDDGIFELQHPGLPEIDPDDFVFAAEYLESSDFGHRNPRDGDDDQMQEAFVQCIAAWGVAEKLCMHDLMDHIVEKLERHIEPELMAVVIFAAQIYEAEETPLPSQMRLKDYLATYIAQNWWIYVGDDHLSGPFIERLKTLPELERDIYARRLVALNERLNDAGDGPENGEMGLG